MRGPSGGELEGLAGAWASSGVDAAHTSSLPHVDAVIPLMRGQTAALPVHTSSRHPVLKAMKGRQQTRTLAIRAWPSAPLHHAALHFVVASRGNGGGLDICCSGWRRSARSRRLFSTRSRGRGPRSISPHNLPKSSSGTLGARHGRRQRSRAEAAEEGRPHAAGAGRRRALTAWRWRARRRSTESTAPSQPQRRGLPSASRHGDVERSAVRPVAALPRAARSRPPRRYTA